MIHLHSKIKEDYTIVKSVELVIFCFQILQGAYFLDVDYVFLYLKVIEMANKKYVLIEKC